MSDSWDAPNVVLRKGGSHAKVTKNQGDLNAARRIGATISTTKSATVGNSASAHRPTDYQKIANLDLENEVKPPAKVDMSVGQAIAKARSDKKDAEGKSMTQKDLATKINEKPQVIGDYEAGRAVPNVALLAKMERALGVKLRGDPKLIGTPLAKPGSKK